MSNRDVMWAGNVKCAGRELSVEGCRKQEAQYVDVFIDELVDVFSSSLIPNHYWDVDQSKSTEDFLGSHVVVLICT